MPKKLKSSGKTAPKKAAAKAPVKRAVKAVAKKTPAKKAPVKAVAKKAPVKKAVAGKKNKYVYTWGAGKADGNGSMKALLGGKGANLAEMASIGLPVPPGFTITTEACRTYLANGKEPSDLRVQVTKALRYLTKFKILPEDIDAKKDLEAIIKVEDWEPKPQPKAKKK